MQNTFYYMFCVKDASVVRTYFLLPFDTYASK